MFETKYNPILARVIQPVRITGIISLIVYCLQTNAPWDPSILSFYAFLFIYLSSFGIELVLTPSKKLKDNIPSLGMKFLQMLPVEAAIAAGFALFTFAPHTNANLLLALETSFVGFVCWIGIELYHKYIVPYLNRKKVTPQIGTLIVIGMTMATFFQGIYYIVLSPHHLIFIQ